MYLYKVRLQVRSIVGIVDCVALGISSSACQMEGVVLIVPLKMLPQLNFG